MNKSKKCTKCNLEFSTKYKFCTECGKELKSLNICQNCDFQLKEKSNFCPNCGNPTLNENITDSWVEEDSPKEESNQSQSAVIGYALSGIIGFIILIFLIMFFAGNSLESLNPTIRTPSGIEIKYSTCLAYDSEQNCKDYFNNNKSDWIIGRLG